MANVALQPQQSSIWWVFLLQGLAGIILGLMLLTEPGATMVALTTLLGFYWLIMGVLALVQRAAQRTPQGISLYQRRSLGARKDNSALARSGARNCTRPRVTSVFDASSERGETRHE